MKRACFLVGLIALTFPRAAIASETDCSLAALKLEADADYRASVSRFFPTESYRSLSCRMTSQTILAVEGLRLRLRLAEILNDGQFKLDAALVFVERLDGDTAQALGHFVLPPDPLDNETRFEPQLVKRDGAVWLRLAPRHARVYRFDGEGIVAVPAFDWREGLSLYPDGGRGGQALGLDLERMEGRIALTPDKSAAAPPSALARPKIGLARLSLKDGRLTPISQEAVERVQGEYAFLDRIAAEEEEDRAAARPRPAGVEPCAFGAWSKDPDPKGLNVRAEPNAKAPILGIVPPPRKAKSEEGAFGDEPIAAEFTVVGYRDGWFLIEDIQPPGPRYGIAYPKGLPAPYKGRGWVAGAMIGAAPANRGMPPGRLYHAPYAEAGFDAVYDSQSNAFGPDYPVARVLACSGSWALIETKDGRRGWTRTLCSNQATNCS